MVKVPKRTDRPENAATKTDRADATKLTGPSPQASGSRPSQPLITLWRCKIMESHPNQAQDSEMGSGRLVGHARAGGSIDEERGRCVLCMCVSVHTTLNTCAMMRPAVRFWLYPRARAPTNAPQVPHYRSPTSRTSPTALMYGVLYTENSPSTYCPIGGSGRPGHAMGATYTTYRGVPLPEHCYHGMHTSSQGSPRGRHARINSCLTRWVCHGLDSQGQTHKTWPLGQRICLAWAPVHN